MQYKSDFYKNPLEMYSEKNKMQGQHKRTDVKKNNESKNEFSVNLDLPYPQLQVNEKNMKYARVMLDNCAGRNSEMTAIATYLYNNINLMHEHSKIAKVFMDVDKVEMHHLHIFSELAKMLGADPRLWTREMNTVKYWSPTYCIYAQGLGSVLSAAINSEKEAIEKYTRQTKIISDIFIVEALERIIKDEEHHMKIFKELKYKYCR